MICIKNLIKRFGPQLVLGGISLEIEQGEVIAVVGPSGVGKSVLLKIITGLLPADSGSVMVDGDEITKVKSERERRRILKRMGVLFQSAALIDSLSLFENVAFPLRAHNDGTSSEIEMRVNELIERVGLSGSQMALPGEVSIGMRKRIGIARALITKPSLILFDEPNTGLDPEVGQEIYELIKDTQQEYGFTGIVISHEIPEVFQICDRVAMLYDGVVQVDGSVGEFLNSANPIVNQFVSGSTTGPIRTLV